MVVKVQDMTHDEWDAQFVPVVNHIDPGHGWGTDEEGGTLWETYGPELAHVEKVFAETPGRVWTLIEADGDVNILSGMHYVNREGFFITEKTAEEGVQYLVTVAVGCEACGTTGYFDENEDEPCVECNGTGRIEV